MMHNRKILTEEKKTKAIRYSHVKGPIVGTALALGVVVPALLVHDPHQLHPRVVLGPVAHPAALPHRHPGAGRWARCRAASLLEARPPAASAPR